MRIPNRWIVGCLALVAFFISAIVFGQPQLPVRPFAQRPLAPNQYQMLSGPDVGFRVEGSDAKGRPKGHWMIRVDGEWVEPAPVLATRPLTN